VNIYVAKKGLNCGINKTVIMVTKITVPDIIKKMKRFYLKLKKLLKKQNQP